MEHASDNEALPMYLPEAYGDDRERREHRKKKKKHRKHTKHHDDDDDRAQHTSSDDGEVKKKKKKERDTEGGEVKKKKKKRRSPEEEYLREAARRKSREHHADRPGDAPIHTKSSRQRPRAEGRGIQEPRVPVPVRFEEYGQVDMRECSVRQPSTELQQDEVDAAFGMSSEGITSFAVQPDINWETGEGLVWPDASDMSAITPLTAFDEPTLREDVEDPFVPVTTSFSGVSPGSQTGRPQWQQEESNRGPESSNDFSGRPGAHRVVNPQYQAPVSRYSHDRRRTSAPPTTLRSGSLISEKRRNSLPPGLYPIAEIGEPPEKKKEKGPLSLFPVDESYDGGNTSKEKSQHRLSYSSTGESYAQLETEQSVPGGTYVATPRISSKRRRRKERGEGPSYFGSSETYNDENLLADSYGRTYDMERQAMGEDRLGAFAVRRTGTNVSGGPEEFGERFEQMDQVGRDQQNLLIQGEESEISTKKTRWSGSKWFILLVAFLLLAGIAVAIAIPLTFANNDSSSTDSYSDEEISYRKDQMRTILEGVSDPSTLGDESSPQHAACEWIASQDVLSPLDNGILSSGMKKLILQRYALAVFYYSTTGDTWFSADGWLDGQREECSWEFIECVNDDVVSIDTGARNNLIGDIPPEMKELKELRSLMLPSNSISKLSNDLRLLQNLVELDLSRNTLGSTIPTEIFEMYSLRRLLLTENSFTGTLSPLITKLAALTQLSLDTNDMSGFLTTEFQAFQDITYLDLSNNRFSGDLNTVVAGLTNLDNLLLVNNPISGTMISDIQQYSNLQVLDLAQTSLIGTIPTGIGALTQLRSLLLEGIGLTGTIPTEFGNLVALENAYLDFNQFQGAVPTEMCSLPALVDLRVDCSNECQCDACDDDCTR